MTTTTRPARSRRFTRATAQAAGERVKRASRRRRRSRRPTGGRMSLAAEFARLSPTSIADALTRDRVMDIGIRPLWSGMPRVAGPAYTVRCAPGDNLMVHAAIYRAAPGDVIVVEAGDVDYAVAGGNVCAIAQRARRGRLRRGRCDPRRRRGAGARLRRPRPRRHPHPGGQGPPGRARRAGAGRRRGRPAGRHRRGRRGGHRRRAVARAARSSRRPGPAPTKDAATCLDAWEKAHRARIDETLRIGFDRSQTSPFGLAPARPLRQCPEGSDP